VPAPRSPETVTLRLQREVGNAAVTRLLARQPKPQQQKPGDPSTKELPITATGVRGAQEWYDRATAHYQAGRYEQALKAYQESYRLHPVAGSLRNQAACLEQLGRNREAADLYERYLAELDKDTYDPNAPKLRERIRQLRGQTVKPTVGSGGAEDAFDRGWAHWQAGRHDEALKAFQEAYRKHSLPLYLYNQASVLVQMGRKGEAADLFERYLTELPKGAPAADADTIRKRIERLRAQAAPAEAPITEKGLAGARAWFDRGQEAFVAGDFHKALESFKEAHRLHSMPDFVFNQGTCLERLGREEAAANAFEHYLLLAPQAKDAQETKDRIRKLREKAAKQGIVDPWADESAAPAVTSAGRKGASEWFSRGALAFELGSYKRAYDCFVRANDLLPLPEFVYNQAASLDKLGNKDAAVQAYERYLLMAPKAKDAANVRKRIRFLRGF
jgi:tetratricopeptide (TPR) repeat protein